MKRRADGVARMAAEVLDLLATAGKTLSTAESLTGGRLAAVITGVPGASRCYLGGVVTYATELKVSLLDVPESLVDEYGVVSAQCARAMAAGVRRVTGASYGLATTGVAGPDRQEGKPVGTVFVGISGAGVETVVAMDLVGDRHQIQDRACREAVSALCAILRGDPGGEQHPLG